MATAPRKALPNPPAATTFDGMTRDELRAELSPLNTRFDTLDGSMSTLVTRMSALETRVSVMDARMTSLPDRGTVWQAALTSVGIMFAVCFGTLSIGATLAKTFGLF